jgi:hypothetical protein
MQKVTRQNHFMETWRALMEAARSADKTRSNLSAKSKGSSLLAIALVNGGSLTGPLKRPSKLLFSNPRAQIRYGAAFQSDLVDFIIPAFEIILEDSPASVRGSKDGTLLYISQWFSHQARGPG